MNWWPFVVAFWIVVLAVGVAIWWVIRTSSTGEEE